MSTATVPPHHVRASQADLLAFARYWEWERTVKLTLPELIAGSGIEILFQPIFNLSRPVPTVTGFEGLSRFPLAPKVPVGLWFRTAQDLGLAAALELVAIRAAMAALEKVSGKAFLFVNASLGTVPYLVELIPGGLEGRLVLDVPYSAVKDPVAVDVFHELRRAGVGIAIDDVPLDDLHLIRSDLRRLRPDSIKVDVLTGLLDDTMARFNLAEASAWCQGVGIRLIAERVERLGDLVVLAEVGVEWAQGYCLSRPILL